MAWSPSDTIFPDLTPDNFSWNQTPTVGGASSVARSSGSSGVSSFFKEHQGEMALGMGMFSSLLGSMMQGQAAMAQANAQRAAAEYNAHVAKLEGDAEFRRRMRINRRTISSQFVQMAGKSGVIAEEGGWLEVLASNAEEMERDALNAAIAGRNTARLERYRGEAAIAIGKQKRTAALIGGFSNLAFQGLSYGLPG